MKKILFIIIIILILGGGVLYYQKNKTSTSGEKTGVIETLKDFFPSSTSRKILENLPFGTSTENSEQQTDEENRLNLNTEFQPISQNQISGASVVMGQTGEKKTSVWYLEKETGYVFSYQPETGKKEQLSNTTWPGSLEVYWGQAKSGPIFILRRIKNSITENYLSQIDSKKSASTSLSELTGINLPINIYSLAVSPSKEQYFYLTTSSEGSVGYIGSFPLNSSPVKIFDSPYPKWQVAWLEENNIIFHTPAQVNQDGLVYSFNIKTRSFERIFGNIKGLTSLFSPDTKKILFAGNDLKLNLKYSSNGATPITLGISTIPEKCLWTKDSLKIYCSVPNNLPSGSYPDDWYQGAINFSDSLWLIDTKTGTTKQIYNPENATGKYKIDGVKLFLTPNEDYLFIINKTDDTLWQLKLTDSFTLKTTASSSSKLNP